MSNGSLRMASRHGTRSEAMDWDNIRRCQLREHGPAPVIRVCLRRDPLRPSRSRSRRTKILRAIHSLIKTLVQRLLMLLRHHIPAKASRCTKVALGWTESQKIQSQQKHFLPKLNLQCHYPILHRKRHPLGNVPFVSSTSTRPKKLQSTSKTTDMKYPGAMKYASSAFRGVVTKSDCWITSTGVLRT